MSQLTSKSRALLGAFLLLLFLQLLPSEQGAELESRSLAPVVEEGLQRIAIGRLGQERVLLERGEEGWSLAAPLEGPADPRLIEALLQRGEVDRAVQIGADPFQKLLEDAFARCHATLPVHGQHGIQPRVQQQGEEAVDQIIHLEASRCP